MKRDRTALSKDKQNWDEILDCFQTGKSAVEAIQYAWSRWQPDANINLLAQMIGAIYADTYWRGIRMRRELLANDLQAGTGKSTKDCKRASRKAFSAWAGLHLRANLEDGGDIPRGNPIETSPDAVANTVELLPSQLIKSWNVVNWGKLGFKNLSYGRAQSLDLGVPVSSPKLAMYYVDAALNPPPSSWVRLYTVKENKSHSPLVNINDNDNVPPKAKCANSLPFDFSPTGTGIYSLVALARTEFFQNSLNQPLRNWDHAQWLRNNGAVGWRNVQIIPSAGFQVLSFYNLEDTAEVFVFSAHASDLPFGSTVRLNPSDLAPAVSEVIDKPRQKITVCASIPPEFKGQLGIEFPYLEGNAGLEIKLRWVLPPEHRHHAQGALLPGTSKRRRELGILLGEFMLS